MGYESIISFTQQPFKKTQCRQDLNNILNSEQIAFLKDWYVDLAIDDQGYLELSDNSRQNCYPENWKGILIAIAEHEGEEITVTFQGLDEKSGYKATPDGKILILKITEEWVAPEEKGDESKC